MKKQNVTGPDNGILSITPKGQSTAQPTTWAGLANVKLGGRCQVTKDHTLYAPVCIKCPEPEDP